MRIRKNKKGFTLVELIVVIAILAILAAVATVSITGIVNRSRDNALKADLQKYKAAYDVWLTEAGTGGTLAQYKAYVHPTTGDYRITGSDTATYGTWATDATKTVALTLNGKTGTINVVTGAITGV